MRTSKLLGAAHCLQGFFNAAGARQCNSIDEYGFRAVSVFLDLPFGQIYVVGSDNIFGISGGAKRRTGFPDKFRLRAVAGC